MADIGREGYDIRALEEHKKYDFMVDNIPDFWWSPENPLAVGLHLLNKIRVAYFNEALGGYKGKRLLDVGCGGGILAESLARAGAEVVAVDPSEKSIRVGRERAAVSGLCIDYRVAFAEDLDLDEAFDAVFAVDVLEHVSDLRRALETCSRLIKKGGNFCFLTHNPSLETFTRLIWEQEYVKKMVPKGVHDFHKFIRPDDLTEMLKGCGIEVREVKGIHFEETEEKMDAWITDDPNITYLGYGIKL